MFVSPSLAPSSPRYEQLKDPLAHPPRSKIIEFPKRHVIYDRPKGRDVVLDVYRAEDFFGESVLLRLARHNERATTLDRGKVMMWETATDIYSYRGSLRLA